MRLVGWLALRMRHRYYGPGAMSSVAWQLSPEQVRSVLLLRKDLDSDEINDLDL